MGTRDQRRDLRLPTRLPVSLGVGKKSFDLLTEDVSSSGVFLRTDTPPITRQLVRLQMALPPDGRAFSTHGMAVHVVLPDNQFGRTPGIGVQFYGIDREARASWEAFIAWLRSNEVADAAGATDPIRRRHPRHAVEIEVRVERASDLYTLYTRDISRGGMFVATELELEVGTALVVHLVHGTGSLQLDAVVRRKGATNGAAGLGIEFVGLDDGKRKAVFDFVTAHLPTVDEVELVDADDPDLA